MLTAQDLKGVLGILPTPAKDGADRIDATNTVDLDETARVVQQLIRDGIDGIIALGTMGECSTLTQQEYEAFVDCLVSTVKRRVPTFVGTTALGAHEVVRRIRFVKELGADGTLLGLPMWQPCTLDMALQYYASIAQMFPDFAIMVYANSRAFRYDFGVEFWRRIRSGAPTVMASKFSNQKILVDAVAASDRAINFVGKETQVHQFAQLSPETTTACWIPAVFPYPAQALMKAITAQNWEQAKQIANDIALAMEPIEPFAANNPEVFASYNIQIEKMFMNAAGYCKAGPIRPPYHVVPEEIAKAAKESGLRYIQLGQKFRRSSSES
jgi:dihydrodipicolinate synthase/N-acetylneuraminate lyase